MALDVLGSYQDLVIAETRRLVARSRVLREHARELVRTAQIVRDTCTLDECRRDATDAKAPNTRHLVIVPAK